MTTAILGIVGSVLLCVIGVWKYVGRKNEFKRKEAEQARKDLDNAKKNDSVSDILDAFDRVRK